jgi:small nuclear ribonucleoprotein (snRNP)-like protein
MASRGGPELGLYLGNEIILETNLKKKFSCKFVGFDEHMNCVVENLQEIDDDSKPIGDKYPEGVIRGRNIISIESIDSIERGR